SENGIGTTDFQARAGPIDETPRGDYSITIPSRLSTETWENRLLAETDGVTVRDGGEGTVTLDVTNKRIRCSAVGPDVTQREGEGISDGDGGDGADINPGGVGEVVYVEATVDEQTNADVIFENQGDETINATQARLNFYFQADQNKDTPTSVTLIDDPDNENTELATLAVGGGTEDFEEPVEFNPNSPHDVRFAFDFPGPDNSGSGGGNEATPKMENDFFVVTVYFDDGTSKVYFVNPQ
ncbi:MAG: hypothetical protein ACOCSP_02065, partial [archaeon]